MRPRGEGSGQTGTQERNERGASPMPLKEGSRCGSCFLASGGSRMVFQVKGVKRDEFVSRKIAGGTKSLQGDFAHFDSSKSCI